MTEDAIKSGINSVKLFLEKTDQSMAWLAKKCGLSTAALSQILSGKYKADPSKHIKLLLNYINEYFRNQEHYNNRPTYVHSAVAREIEAVITNTQSFSQEEGAIGIIIGDSGHGKTICLKSFCTVHEKLAFYVSLHDSQGIKDIFADIAQAVGADYTGSVNKVISNLISSLLNRHATIILDEASNMDVKKLNRLRQIICVSCRCPLILSGNNHLFTTLNSDTGRRGYESIDQFASRIIRIAHLDDMANNGTLGGGELYPKEDICKLYEYRGIKLATDAVDALKNICMTPGSGRLRTCNKIITAAHTSSQVKSSGVITREHIIGAIISLGLPFQNKLPMTIMKPKKRQQAKAATA